MFTEGLICLLCQIRTLGFALMATLLQLLLVIQTVFPTEIIMVNNVTREICSGCCKNIYVHNAIAICQDCSKAMHDKCAMKFMSYNNIDDEWLCAPCMNAKPERYNPFKSYNKFYKHLPNHESDNDDIAHISHILSNCNNFNRQNFKHILEYKEITERNSNSFSIVFNNIDGNSSNFDKFVAEISSTKTMPTIVALAETNIDECHKNLYNINGYDSVYQSKIHNKKKGSGLGMYILDELQYTVIDEHCVCSRNIECLFVSIINSTGPPIIVGVVYRPPSGNIEMFYKRLEEIFSRLPTRNVFITGDFNIDLHKNCSKFENVMFGYGYAPSISIATHEKPGCTPSCIDNIITNSSELLRASGVLTSNVSHHFPIFCVSDVITMSSNNPNSTKSTPSYDYSEANMVCFMGQLADRVCGTNDIGTVDQYNEAHFEEFVTKLTTTIDECFLTDASKKSTKRNRLMKKSKSKHNKLGDESKYIKYKNYRKHLNIVIKQAKSCYYSRKFESAKGNIKKTWEIINELRGKKHRSLKPSFIINSNVVQDRRVIANEFNKYFVSIAHNMNNKLTSDIYESGIPITSIPTFEQFMDKKVTDSIYLSECTDEEIIETINNLKNGKSSDIAIHIIKRCSRIIAPTLCQFMNNFISLGLFPQVLKVGRITPIYKKGNPQLFDNYRPISTLSLLGKIFEKLIYSRLYSFLSTKSILYKNQFGFRKQHSTSHAVNYSVTTISSHLENGQHVIGLFIDLST